MWHCFFLFVCFLHYDMLRRFGLFQSAELELRRKYKRVFSVPRCIIGQKCPLRAPCLKCLPCFLWFGANLNLALTVFLAGVQISVELCCVQIQSLALSYILYKKYVAIT